MNHQTLEVLREEYTQWFNKNSNVRGMLVLDEIANWWLDKLAYEVKEAYAQGYNDKKLDIGQALLQQKGEIENVVLNTIRETADFHVDNDLLYNEIRSLEDRISILLDDKPLSK